MTTKLQEAEQAEFDPYDDIEDDDYAFIIGADGELKSVFMPDSAPFRAPKKVLRILKLFGINDLDNLTKDETLH